MAAAEQVLPSRVATAMRPAVGPPSRERIATAARLWFEPALRALPESVRYSPFEGGAAVAGLVGMGWPGASGATSTVPQKVQNREPGTPGPCPCGQISGGAMVAIRTPNPIALPGLDRKS